MGGGNSYYTPIAAVGELVNQSGGQVTIINPPYHSQPIVWRKGWAKKLRIWRLYFYISNCRMKKRPIRDLMYGNNVQDHCIENKRKLYERQGGRCPHCGQPSFITNFIDDPRVWLCPSLKNKLNAVAGASEHPTEKKNYPANAINSAQMGKFLSRGVEIKMPKDECVLIGNLDELSRVGMKIFGGGVIFSDRIAEEMQRHKATFERDVELSARERRIVEQLNKKEL